MHSIARQKWAFPYGPSERRQTKSEKLAYFCYKVGTQTYAEMTVNLL